MMNEELERYRPLLMGLLDGELSPQEVREVNEALMRNADLRNEYEKMREGSGKLESLSLLEPEEKIAEQLWKRPHHRLFRNQGVWLILGGYVLLIGYGLFCMIVEDGPALPKIAIAAIFLGIATLLYTFIRERMETSKADPYKDIKR